MVSEKVTINSFYNFFFSKNASNLCKISFTLFWSFKNKTMKLLHLQLVLNEKVILNFSEFCQSFNRLFVSKYQVRQD